MAWHTGLGGGWVSVTILANGWLHTKDKLLTLFWSGDEDPPLQREYLSFQPLSAGIGLWKKIDFSSDVLRNSLMQKIFLATGCPKILLLII